MSSSLQSGKLLPLSTCRGSIGVLSLGLAQRITLFILLSAAEWFPFLRWFRTPVGGVGIGGQSAFRFGLVCGSLFLALGYVKAGSFRRISRELEKIPINWRYFAANIGFLLGFIYLSRIPFGGAPISERVIIALACYSTAIAAVVCAALAVVPPKLAWQLVRDTGFTWAYVLPLALLVWLLISVSPYTGDYIWNGPFWRPAINLTFSLVEVLLHLFYPQAAVDRATMSIGSPDFTVTIGQGCSGWEGTALMLVFIIWWLCVLRREFRFPQALLLVPAALATMWISNAVRITALILIGLSGAPDVAMGGFHSEAGWIAFNCVALSFAVASLKVRWLTVRSPEPSVQDALVTSTTAAYLMPFLVILAVGMISRAASSGFEWLYPLRLISGAAVLWFFRSKYSEMDWSFDWFSIVLGGVVFLIWLALPTFSGNQTDHVTLSGLAIPPGSLRIAWVVCRIAAAVFTVPLAEELAFRGFLIRRLIWRDFDALDPQAHTLFSVVISSIVFGLLHGSRWPAGTVAGLLYALAFLRRGRIGDATVAHATTNGCLAIWVLWTDNWSLG